MRRTGHEGLHERVVEDKREQRLERMTWREAADALLEAYHAVDCVPDPGLSGHRTLARMKAAHVRALANAETEALESEEL